MVERLQKCAIEDELAKDEVRHVGARARVAGISKPLAAILAVMRDRSDVQESSCASLCRRRIRGSFAAAAVLFLLQACTPERPSAPLPGTNLRARLAARLENERPDLRQSLGHYGLVYDVSQEELHQFMAQIYPRHDGPDIVMAALGGIELHGGGVLELIATLWRPNGRSAELSDAFPFASTGRAVPLQEIYDSLRMQIFLPLPTSDAEEIAGQLPTSPTLPRMRIQHATHGRLEETELDAYNALDLLVRYEKDLHKTWLNRVDQRISAAALLESSWNHYLVPRSAKDEFSDHSYLHLVEILLAYNRRIDADLRHDPNDLKRRLLNVELERREYGGYEASEALGHYVESVGFLLAEPRIIWTESERTKLIAWLRDLEEVRLREIEEAPVQHLAHLLRGLDRIESNADRLR